jgi:hypothetical protein
MLVSGIVHIIEVHDKITYTYVSNKIKYKKYHTIGNSFKKQIIERSKISDIIKYSQVFNDTYQHP